MEIISASSRAGQRQREMKREREREGRRVGATAAVLFTERQAMLAFASGQHKERLCMWAFGGGGVAESVLLVVVVVVTG